MLNVYDCRRLCYNESRRNMTEKIIIPTNNGNKKAVELPNYGEVIVTVRNGKVTNIRTINDNKIC